MSTTIGNRIRECRRNLDMTQEELGQKIGCTKATINKYETGVVVNLRRPVIEKLAEALSTTPAYLMGWDSVNVNNNNGVIGQNNGSITIDNSVRPLSKEEAELLRIYNKLDVRERLKLLNTAIELEEASC